MRSTQAGAAVGRAGTPSVTSYFSPMLLEGGQLDLEELDRHPPDGDLGLGDDGGRDQAHRLDRVLGGGVLDVHVDVAATPVTVRVVVPMPSISHPERLEEEAEVLDHVVGAGVADHRLAGVAGCRQQDVLGDGVAALGEDDGAAGWCSGGSTEALVEPVGGGRRRGRRRAAPTGAARRCGCRGRSRRRRAAGSCSSSCSSGPRNMITVRVRRAASTSMLARSSRAGGTISRSLLSGSQRMRTPMEVQHLDDPVDLLDAGQVAQGRAALVEQARRTAGRQRRSC